MYRVKNWERHFENNRSRKVQDLRWVPVPNRHDGEGYATIMEHKDAAEIFAAWVLILQVASRCHPRGVLVREDGTPMTAHSMGIRTRTPAKWFEKAFSILLQVGWLERLAAETSLDCHLDATCESPDCQAGDEEEKERKKRMEGKEQALTRPTIEEITEFCKAQGLLESDAIATFHKWESNGWTNGNRPIKNWKATIQSWKAAGYMPSQKNSVAGKQNNAHLPPSKRY